MSEDILERAKDAAENIDHYAYYCDFEEARLVILALIPEVERLRSHHIQIMGKIRAWILNDCAEVCRGFDWRDDEITRLRNESDAWKAKAIEEIVSGQRLRIVFNGESSVKPVIANLVLACQTPVNILFADTKVIDGKTYGHMLLQLPDEPHQTERVTAWLDANGVGYSKEV